KKADEDHFNADTRNDRGLLARLGALSELTSNNATLRTAYLMLLLFITTIEVLPVFVKFLMNLAPPTTYDAILERAEKADIDTADVELDYKLNLTKYEFEERRRREEETVRNKVDRTVAVEDELHDRETKQWRSARLGEGPENRQSGGRRTFRLWRRRE